MSSSDNYMHRKRMLELAHRKNMPQGSWRERREKAKLWPFRILSGMSLLMIVGVIGVLWLFLGAILFFAVQVPPPSELANRSQAQSTKIYDRNNVLLYEIFQDKNRTPIKLADLPDYVKESTISIEDKDFYKHQGFSITGILRSVYLLTTTRKVQGGGSTLTQQLVKNVLLSGEQSVARKIKEFILAVQVERVYTKDQILEMYLNEIPYGGTAYGVEAASNLYFGKSAKDLSLAEAALLAGLPQKPSVYSPYGSQPELAKERQKQVLKRMIEDGYITQAQYQDALEAPLKYKTIQKEQGIKAPHFVLYVKEKLIERFGDKLVEQGGLRVVTTLDYGLQQKAEDTVKTEVDKLKGARVGNGAAVILDTKTGQILAMVGSKDYFGESEPASCVEGKSCTFEPNVNATLSLRQPGSATKPITYAKALEKGYTANYTLMDVKTEFPGGFGQPSYNPVNYDGRWHGPVQVRYALANSFNIPAVKMLALVGIKDVMSLAYDMGLTTWEPTDENVSNVGLSLTLGGRETRLLDLTSAFATFGNQGKNVDPTSILKVTDAKDNALFEYRTMEGRRVVDDGISFVISDILADNGARTAAFGPNSVLVIPGKTVAVKTGTTDQKKDNWTIGYTPSRTVGVWVGNNNNTAMDPVIASGITGASPIWNKLMIQAISNLPNEPFIRPGKVIQMDVDGLVSGTPKDGSPSRKEYFIAGTEPKESSTAYQRAKVCRQNPHRLANDSEDGDDKDVIVLKEDDPTGADKWQKGIDEWVLTSPDPRLVGATKGCNGIPGFSSGGGAIQIINVGNGANVPRVFDVLAAVNSPAGVKKVIWSVDGADKATQTSEPFSVHIEFPPGDTGSHSISATLEDNDGKKYSTSIGVTVAL